MFEIFGVITLRIYGWGWLWGIADFREFNKHGGSHSAFGNGSMLFPIGIFSIIFHTVIFCLIFGVQK